MTIVFTLDVNKVTLKEIFVLVSFYALQSWHFLEDLGIYIPFLHIPIDCICGILHLASTNTCWIDDYFSFNSNKMYKPMCYYSCSFCCSWLQEYSLQYEVKQPKLHDLLSLIFNTFVLARHVLLLSK